SFLIGDASHALAGLPQLSLQGGGAGDSLVLDDEANRGSVDSQFEDFSTFDVTTVGNSPSFAVTQSGVTYTNKATVTDELVRRGRAPAVDDVTTYTSVTQINYSKIAQLEIRGATPQSFHVAGVALDSGATGNVFSVAETSPLVTIDAGDGGDRVYLGNLLEAIGAVTVNGGTGTTLTLDDRGNVPVGLNAAAIGG